MARTFSFADLPTADLLVDALYEGGTAGHAGDDPIARLLPGAGNQGGFRAAGSRGFETFVVLYTSGEDGDWPDTLDAGTGQFIYYGDNKRPGHALHDTPRGGNTILREAFQRLHGAGESRASIPPFFVFMKAPTPGSSRTVQFKGLAVPGFPGVSMTNDLVAVWKSSSGQRFQNYRAIFTILDAAVVDRGWLQCLTEGKGGTPPMAWVKWLATRAYEPLTAQPTRVIRSALEQTPDTPLKTAVLHRVWEHFKNSPIAFESFAARIYQMTDQRVIVDEVTRAVVDRNVSMTLRHLAS